MFIFAFVIIVALTQFFSSKALKINISNSLSYTYSKRDSLIMVGFFLLSIGLQFVPLKDSLFWIICGIYSAALLMTMTILSTIKKTIILKQKEELQKIFDVLEPVFPKNTEFDPNNPPFKLCYEGNTVNKITISINPNTFKEAVATNLCLSLNKYLPNYEWVNEFDFAARECSFVGTPLPPFIAKYKGSWLRPTEFVPIGLSGLGEVSWNINSFKNEGRSNYIYDDGKIAKTVDTPTAPQLLCVGSPLGLDTIIPTTLGYKTMETIEVGDYVFGYKNIPVKVTQVHSIIYNPKNIYELTFNQESNCITIISDECHRFPVCKESYIIPVQCKDLNVNDVIASNSKNYVLTQKKLLDYTQPVRCITVDSEEHLFLVTDHIESEWNGGNKYCYPAVLVFNTGGGKSIYIEQEVEVKEN